MTDRKVHEVRFRHASGARAMVEVVRLEELRARRLDHTLYAPQRRDFHLFHLVHEGAGRHHFEFGSVPLRAGDLFQVRPGQVDWFDEGSDHRALLLLFVPEAVAEPGLLRLRLNNPLRPSAGDFARLEALVRGIEDFQDSPKLVESTRHLLQAFVSAVDALQAEAASASPSAAKLALCERFDQLLADPRERQRSVGDYAEQLGVSAKTLARACSVVFGHSPKRHIDLGIALQAKRLLVHTGETVEAIALRLGFSEATNFTKFFRRVEGCTPQGFRDRFRTGRED